MASQPSATISTIGAGNIPAVNTKISAITDRNASVSPLLRLPAELRNRVYEYVLYEGTYIFADMDQRKDKDGEPTGFLVALSGIRVVPIDHDRLSILRVSRQIYAETALLPFSLNTFAFLTSAVRVMVDNVLTPAQRGAIVTLRFRLLIETESVFWRIMRSPFEFSWLSSRKDQLAILKKLSGLKQLSVVTSRTQDLDYTGGDVVVDDEVSDDISAHWLERLRFWLNESCPRHVEYDLAEEDEDSRMLTHGANV